MQRLTDIVQNDLDTIFDHYRDITRIVKIQAAGIVHKVMCSLQGDKVEFSSDTTPINAFHLSLYYRDLDDEAFNQAIKKNAIIYIDGTAYKIIDTMSAMGLRTMALERHGGR